jgi:glycosyltransferase involved in cell wall biosynthesis
MKILISLTYFRPHVSGLTIYVERLAKGLASRGHKVTVLCSRHDWSLPKEEILDGVRILRVPVRMRISKGVLMPRFPAWAWREIKKADVISAHLPQFESFILGGIAKVHKKPLTLTYHCDIQLPKHPLARPAEKAIHVANHIAGKLATKVIAYTQDYANHSPFLRRFAKKIKVILPPVEIKAPDSAKIEALKKAYKLEGKKVAGFAARFAEEKGIDYLIDAVPKVLEKVPMPSFCWPANTKM